MGNSWDLAGFWGEVPGLIGIGIGISFCMNLIDFCLKIAVHFVFGPNFVVVLVCICLYYITGAVA